MCLQLANLLLLSFHG